MDGTLRQLRGRVDGDGLKRLALVLLVVCAGLVVLNLETAAVLVALGSLLALVVSEQVPSDPDASAEERQVDTRDPEPSAVETAQREYARGAIDEAELERRLDAALEAEGQGPGARSGTVNRRGGTGEERGTAEERVGERDRRG